MKLLFVIKSLALPGGGAERVLADVTAGLVERGHDVTILSFDAEDADDFYLFDPRLRRLRLGIGPVARRSDVRRTLQRMGQLRRLAREEEPDVAIGFMHSAYIPLAFALASSAVPVVASEHTVFEHYDSRPLERALLRAMPPFLCAITGISESMRQSFPPAIQRKMVVIPNPIRVGELTGSGQNTVNRVLAVGRLEREKDHRTLIAAFARIAPEFPGWRMRIVGEGSLRPSLETQVRALGIERQVELPGATADIAREYQAASILAVPSVYESFGIATAEAMAHGVPVIGFADCPGTNELILDGVNGVLAKGDDRVGGLAEALGLLMSSKEERVRLGSAGPARAADFSPDRVIDGWEQLLQSCGRP